MGATFGRDTFKQNILEYIEEQCEEFNYDHFTGVEHVMEVVSFMVLNAHRRDKALAELYENAKNEARNELISQLNSTKEINRK